jgi:hypothetical protein
MKHLLNRLYGDYLMPSRLGQYDALLRQANDAGYAQLSVRAFMDAPSARALVHRHDIDSDLRTARKMFEIETKLGVKASYYFRLCTLDRGFMRAIDAYGSEASYHYEEAADFAKERGIRDAAELRRHFPALRLRFAANLARVEQLLGAKITTVASHGDFVNRRLRVINHELLQDSALRAACGIAWEAYDAEVLARFDVDISDRPHPVYYAPISPFTALGRHRRICLLTHPVQWETNWRESTVCIARRLYEELTW